jgi:hypothetical protein
VASLDAGPKFQNKELIVGKHLLDVREFLPFIQYLYDKLREMESVRKVIILRKEEWKNNTDSEKIAESLLAGKIYWDKIIFPEAVLYHLLKKSPILKEGEEFPFIMATILTFWDAHLQWQEKKPRVFLRKK